MKLRIRYLKKADVPTTHAAFYSPVDANDPEGPQMFSGFEPDPDGYAIVNASKLQSDLTRITADKKRQDAVVQRFRRKDSTELLTEDEMTALFNAQTQLAEMTGKVADADTIRKQVAAEIGRQWEGKHKEAMTIAEQKQAIANAYRQALQDALRQHAAAMAMGELKPKKGLGEIATERLAREFVLEEVAKEGQPIPEFQVRVKGPNGYRVDQNGKPIAPGVFAKEHFAKDYGEMFEAVSPNNGTGTPGSNGNPSQVVPSPGQRGSGKFRMLQKDMLGNTSEYRKQRAAVPKGDYLQILSDDGQKVIEAVPSSAT